MGCAAVNMKMLPVKMTYFLTLGGVSSLLPYLNLYMRQIGLSYSEIGIIYGTMPFIAAIIRTLVGGLADKLQKHQVILMTCCLLTGVLHACLLWVPRDGSTTRSELHTVLPVNLACTSSEGSIQMCQSDQIWNALCQENDPGLRYSPEAMNKSEETALLLDMFQHATHCALSFDVPLAESAGNGTGPVCVHPAAPGERAPCLAGFRSDLANFNFSLSSGLQPTQEGHDYGIYGSESTEHCLAYDVAQFSYDGVLYERVSCSQSMSMSGSLLCTYVDVPHSSLPCTRPANSTAMQQTYDNVGESAFGKTFWYFFIIFLLGQIAFGPIFSLIDALVYAYLGKEGGKWGLQRLWGSVGFAIFALIAGFMMDLFQESQQEKNFIFCFVSYAVCCMVSGIIVCFYSISTDLTSTSLIKNVGDLLTRFEVLILFITIFLYGVYTGLIETCLYVHLFDLGGNGLLVGLCMLMNCIPEIFVLLAAGVIIKRLGYFSCLTIVYAAYAIRLLGYAFIKKPWVVLVLEPLHSITFGLMYATVTSYGNDITPPGMQGTVQSIIGALYFGFGKGVGGVSSSQVLHYAGAFPTFLGYGMSAVAFLVIFVILNFAVIRRMHKKKTAAKKSTAPDTEPEAEVKMLNNVDDAQDDATTKSAASTVLDPHTDAEEDVSLVANEKAAEAATSPV